MDLAGAPISHCRARAPDGQAFAAGGQPVYLVLLACMTRLCRCVGLGQRVKGPAARHIETVQALVAQNPARVAETVQKSRVVRYQDEATPASGAGNLPATITRGDQMIAWFIKQQEIRLRKYCAPSSKQCVDRRSGRKRVSAAMASSKSSSRLSTRQCSARCSPTLASNASRVVRSASLDGRCCSTCCRRHIAAYCTLPALGSRLPANTSSRLLLPQPLWPIRPMRSPVLQ